MDMPFSVSHILDHGTQNPIIARLTVQIFEIIDQCDIAKEASDGVYMNSLAKKLLRCWEIVERYRLEFIKQTGSYKRPQAQSQIVVVPYVIGLEEECHNFLYEAKNFLRDLLKACNFSTERNLWMRANIVGPNREGNPYRSSLNRDLALTMQKRNFCKTFGLWSNAWFQRGSRSGARVEKVA